MTDTRSTGPLRWNNCTDVLARTIWVIGRHGGQMLMHGLACAMENRARQAAQHFIQHKTIHPHFGDGTLAKACLKLPCWQRHDPGLPLMERITNDDPDFDLALRIAGLACQDSLEPIVASATHFLSYDQRQHIHPGHWSESMHFVRLIWDHSFYCY